MFRCKLKAIDTNAFHKHVSQIFPAHPEMTFTELNAHLTSLLNKHAPVTKHIQKRKKITPWFTPEILVAKRERRRAERAWRKSGPTVRKEISKQNKNAVTCLVLKAKTDYLNAQVAESKSRKQLFSVTNSLLSKSKVSPLPTNIPAAQLPILSVSSSLQRSNK